LIHQLVLTYTDQTMDLDLLLAAADDEFIDASELVIEELDFDADQDPAPFERRSMRLELGGPPPLPYRPAQSTGR
jgi:hypothetical protein